jgi:DNA polymerase III subunit delta
VAVKLIVRIESNQLAPNLQRALATLYVIAGDETLLQLEAVDRITQTGRKQGYAEREVFTVEPGFDWQRLLTSGNSLSLFAAKRIIELRIPQGKPGVEGSAVLQQYAARLPDDAITIVTLPRLDRNAQSSDWFSALAAVGTVVGAEPVTREQLPQWIRQRLAQNRQEADEPTLALLVERTEGNLLAARNEVEKLALLFPPGRLDAGQVRQAVMDVARFDVYDLSAALLIGDAQRFRRTLEGLQQEGEAAPLILWSLSNELRTVALLLAASDSGRSVQDLMREHRVWGPRQGPMQRALRRLRLPEVQQALAQAARVDRMVKGVAAGDAWQGLLELGLSLCGVRLVTA